MSRGATRQLAAPSVASGGTGPALPSAHSLNQPSICPTGFDPPRPIVMPGGGAQVAMSKQVARDTDLIGRHDSPRGGTGITAVMWGYVDTESGSGMPRKNRPYGGIIESGPAWADP
jgi:hypothetical protein